MIMRYCNRTNSTTKSTVIIRHLCMMALAQYLSGKCGLSRKQFTMYACMISKMVPTKSCTYHFLDSWCHHLL